MLTFLKIGKFLKKIIIFERNFLGKNNNAMTHGHNIAHYFVLFSW